MGYIVRKSQFRPWPVTVRLNVADDQGVVTPVEYVFIGHFKPFTEAEHANLVEEIDDMFEKPEGKDVLPRATVLKRNAAYFGRLLGGWGGVVDEAGAEIAYSLAALTDMVTGPDGWQISEGVFEAIAQIRNGSAPEKNSLTSAAPGEQSRAAEATAAATTQTSPPSV